jgi:WD40 repeat protein
MKNALTLRHFVVAAAVAALCLLPFRVNAELFPYWDVSGESQPDKLCPVRDQGKAQAGPYDAWVQRFADRNATGYFGKSKLPIRCVITAVEGDEKNPTAGRLALNERVRQYGCRVSTNGSVQWFYFDCMGAKGSGYPQLPARDLQRLNRLISELPGDGSQLPPPDRRLMIQVWDNGHSLERVYDRANAPADVLEILRLSSSCIRSWVPSFRPTQTWSASGVDDGALRLSPDGRAIVSCSMHGPMKFWSIDRHELLKEIATPPDIPVTGISFSPDGSVVALQGWGEISLLETQTWKRVAKLTEPWIGRRRYQLKRPQFVENGRFLLTESDEPALKAFDPKTGQPQHPQLGIPRDAVTYIPAASAGPAVYVSKDGKLGLWDSTKQRRTFVLDVNCVVDWAAFSPNGSQVAIVTSAKTSVATSKRIRIWNLSNGKLMHELRPFEQTCCERVDGITWSGDGKYVLAATKSSPLWSSVGIDVWNAKSGRQRGEFEGCPSCVTGFVLLDNGRQLIAGCSDGRIRVWNAGAAFKEIGDLEKLVD